MGDREECRCPMYGTQSLGGKVLEWWFASDLFDEMSCFPSKED